MTKNDWRKFVKINTAITLNVFYIIKIQRTFQNTT